MKKVIGLAFLASFLATPALAGETFVRNQWSNSRSFTKTDLHLNSHTNSYRNEDYSSWAAKFSYEGEQKYPGGKYSSGSSSKKDDKKHSGSYQPKKGNTDGFSVHLAGSELTGNFHEKSYSHVYGKIKTRTNENTHSHETSSGIR